MEYALSVRNISKTYQIFERPQDRFKQFLFKKRAYYKKFNALKKINFSVKKGETVGIVGRNGSGKSTLLQIIAGTLAPTTGHIEINGRVAALLELGSGFNPEYTGRENVYLNASILGLAREEIERKIPEILQFADIGDFIDQPVKTYSSGMYVRLAFAVSINVDPDILIVDEALAVGDARFQLKCFEKIKSLKEDGKTILVVSHDMQTVRQICDTVVLIDRGTLLNIGTPNDIINEFTKVLFSDVAEAVTREEVQSEGEFKGADSSVGSEKEYRYGSFEGKIKNIYLPNEYNENIKVLTITSGEKIKIGYRAEAYKDISTPIFAMTVKTVKGFDVYGTNSYFQNHVFQPMKENETRVVYFEQDLDLLPGDYFISFGFVELVNGEVVPLDRRYDVIEMKVLSKLNDRSYGVANLNSKITFE